MVKEAKVVKEVHLVVGVAQHMVVQVVEVPEVPAVMVEMVEMVEMVVMVYSKASLVQVLEPIPTNAYSTPSINGRRRYQTRGCSYEN